MAKQTTSTERRRSRPQDMVEHLPDWRRQCAFALILALMLFAPTSVWPQEDSHTHTEQCEAPDIPGGSVAVPPCEHGACDLACCQVLGVLPDVPSPRLPHVHMGRPAYRPPYSSSPDPPRIEHPPKRWRFLPAAIRTSAWRAMARNRARTFVETDLTIERICHEPREIRVLH